MSQVDTVALWMGLFSGIASIILAVVAILFTERTDARAQSINEQVIKSLQKIESAVEQQSSDTRQLIKGAWDKMLGSVGSGEITMSGTSAKELASGLAEELREELVGPGKASAELPPDALQKLNDALQKLEATMAAQLQQRPATDGPSRQIDFLTGKLKMLSPVALAMIEIVADHQAHLSAAEYHKLLQHPFTSDALSELRREGLLVPLRGHGPSKDSLVYYLPPGYGAKMRAAFGLVASSDREIKESVAKIMRAAGYPRAAG